MHCSLNGSCVDVALEAYKSVPVGTIPFVVVQYVLCRPAENGQL